MKLMDYSKPKPRSFWTLISILGLGITLLYGIIWFAFFPAYGKPDVLKNLIGVMPYVVGLLIFIFIGAAATMYVVEQANFKNSKNGGVGAPIH